MAITVKKRRGTVKTVKSKAKLNTENPPEPVEEKPAEEKPVEEKPVAVAPPPQSGTGRVRVDGRKYTYAVVFAILAILMFIGLIALQSLELSFYYQPRSVFLRKIPVTTMPSAPVSAPSPVSSDAE
ncbi:MAG: hypothetical protein KAH23_04490 [Kiritimatiellae bacterium]|nr:hypothetical protein [Kiritimatiellia bacterium]